VSGRLARRPRRRTVALCVAAAALAVGSLWASTIGIGGTPAPPRWSWPDAAPGRPVAVPEPTVDLARRAGLEARDLRELVAAGEGARRASVLATPDASRGVCLSLATATTGGDFVCPASTLANSALVDFASFGGPSPQTLEWGRVVGVARSDVASVRIRLVDGSEVAPVVNRWRGFGYYGDGQRIPRTVEAIATDGSVLYRDELAPAPLCGGPAGPCTSFSDG
jgi:hypothetical protein